MNATEIGRLTELLWPHGDGPDDPQVYWLLDGARDPAIAPLVRAGRLEYACLFTGELHPRLVAAAPYLVHLGAGSRTTNALLQRGWGKAWGIIAIAAPHVTLPVLRRHFKKLLRVRTEEGTELFFRFYDPRVLGIYLPTCTEMELQAFFGPLARLVVEEGDGGAVRIFEPDGRVIPAVDSALSPSPAGERFAPSPVSHVSDEQP